MSNTTNTQDPNQDPSEYREDARMAALIGRWMARFAYVWVGITQVILGLGFVLELFGADPNTEFVAWIYRSVARSMEPFRGMFSPATFSLGPDANVPSVFDASLLVGMLLYGLLAGAFHALIRWLTHQIRKIEAQRLELRREQTYMQASQQAGYASTQARIADEHQIRREEAERRAQQPDPQPVQPQTNIEYNEYSLTQNVDETDYGR